MNEHKNPGRKSVAAVICAIGLAACGGGGGDSNPAAGSTAEGVYGGTLTGSSSSAFQLLVLENGEFWAMYGTQTSTVFGVAGFIQGSGTSNNGSFTSANTKDFGLVPAVAGSTSATYNATAKTITGTVTATGGTVGFSGGPIPGSLYNYDAPASLATVSGAWSTTSLAGETVAINIAGTGSFTAASSLGCNFSGSVAPRSSGKNVFNVSLTFGAAPCALPSQPATGIAVAYPLASGQTQLIVAVTNSGRTVGTAAFGAR
jgi:hypothetical protein